MQANERVSTIVLQSAGGGKIILSINTIGAGRFSEITFVSSLRRTSCSSNL